MLCFNANIEHSKKVTEEMCNKGLKAKHLDGNDDIEYRKSVFQWLKHTPDAILCNVGIATTGFDEPSVEGVIINKATKSLTLYKQMCGRSARSYKYPDGGFKTEHIILDMGDNVGPHGVWSEETDWEDLFLNPHIPGNGIAPVKKCPVCRCMNAASARICKGKIEEKDCGHVFPIDTIEEDTFERDMVRVTNGIHVKNIIELFKNRSEYFSFYEIIKEIALAVRSLFIGNNINQTEFEQLCEMTNEKVDEWLNLIEKEEGGQYKNAVKNTLLTELRSLGFIINNKENNMQDTLNMKVSQAERELDAAIKARSTDQRIIELRNRLYEAKDALEEYKDSLITPEQKAAFSLFEDLQTKKALLNSEFVDLQDRIAALDNELATAEIAARLARPEKFTSDKVSTPLKNNRNKIKGNPETSYENTEIPDGGIKIFSNYKGGLYEATFFAADSIVYKGVKYTSPTTPANGIAGSVNGWRFWKHKVNGKDVTIEDLRK